MIYAQWKQGYSHKILQSKTLLILVLFLACIIGVSAQTYPTTIMLNGGLNNALSGTNGWNYSVESVESDDYYSTGGFCNNSGYVNISVGDYWNTNIPSSLTNVSDLTITVLFTMYDAASYGGLVSVYDDQLDNKTGWSLGTDNSGNMRLRYYNGTSTNYITFDEYNWSGLDTSKNYSMTFVLTNGSISVWLNNVRVEKSDLLKGKRLLAHPNSMLWLGRYTSTVNSYFDGEIHAVYVNNESITPEKAVQQEQLLCGQTINPISTQRYGVWPLTNTTMPNWTHPDNYDRIVDPYGYRKFGYHTNDLDFHRGIDLSNSTGLAIHAVMKGTLVRAENYTQTNNTPRERFGNWMMIKHSPDPDTGLPRHTAYIHMNTSCPLQGIGDFPYGLSENDTISQGQIIGCTGISGEQIDKPHLHFEYIRGLNQDTYGNMYADHPYRILNYTDVDNSNAIIYETSTEYIMRVTQKYDDLDLVGITFNGTNGAFTVDYESKEGLWDSTNNVSQADRTCGSTGICFYPYEFPYPYTTYTINYTINKSIIGTLNNAQFYTVKDGVEQATWYTPDNTPPIITNFTSTQYADIIDVNITVYDAESQNISVGGYCVYNKTTNYMMDYVINISNPNQVQKSTIHDDNIYVIMGNGELRVYNLSMELEQNTSLSTSWGWDVSVYNNTVYVSHGLSELHVSAYNKTDLSLLYNTSKNIVGAQSERAYNIIANEHGVFLYGSVWYSSSPPVNKTVYLSKYNHNLSTQAYEVIHQPYGESVTSGDDFYYYNNTLYGTGVTSSAYHDVYLQSYNASNGDLISLTSLQLDNSEDSGSVSVNADGIYLAVRDNSYLTSMKYGHDFIKDWEYTDTSISLAYGQSNHVNNEGLVFTTGRGNTSTTHLIIQNSQGTVMNKVIINHAISSYFDVYGLHEDGMHNLYGIGRFNVGGIGAYRVSGTLKTVLNNTPTLFYQEKNVSTGQNLSCYAGAYDGQLFGTYGNVSTNVTIPPTPGTIIILEPLNNTISTQLSIQANITRATYNLMSANANCELNIDTTPHTTFNATYDGLYNFSPSLNNTKHEYYITCTDTNTTYTSDTYVFYQQDGAGSHTLAALVMLAIVSMFFAYASTRMNKSHNIVKHGLIIITLLFLILINNLMRIVSAGESMPDLTSIIVTNYQVLVYASMLLVGVYFVELLIHYLNRIQK